MSDENRHLARYSPGMLVAHGIFGGISAGTTFLMAEMFINTFIGRPFFELLRLNASIFLGAQVIAPNYPSDYILVLGFFVNIFLSSIFSILFFILLTLVAQLKAPARRKLLLGSLYGLSLWVVNFLILAPLFFPQFTRLNQVWNGFFAHTFFFGTVLGSFTALVRPPEE